MKYLITKYNEVFEAYKTDRDDFEYDLNLLDKDLFYSNITLRYRQKEIDDEVENGAILIVGVIGVREYLYQQRLKIALDKLSGDTLNFPEGWGVSIRWITNDKETKFYLNGVEYSKESDLLINLDIVEALLERIGIKNEN